MNPIRYWGYSPLTVSKDAKYHVTATGEIRLEYQQNRRVRWLLTTGAHPALVDMVNEVKRGTVGYEGGAFYINEFGAVLVPDGAGGRCYWAGDYKEVLEFRDGDLFVSPRAPSDLDVGEPWPGPRVGIKYTLNAGGSDLRYELVDGRRRETVYLSDDVGPSAASRTASVIRAVKGGSGGPFYINECRELFAPVGGDGEYRYLYVGPLGDLPWFEPPLAPA